MAPGRASRWRSSNPAGTSAAWSPADSPAPTSASAKSSADTRSSSTGAPALPTTWRSTSRRSPGWSSPRSRRRSSARCSTKPASRCSSTAACARRTASAKPGARHGRHHHGERRAVHRQDLRRCHLRRRPHGAGRRHLHLGARKLRAVRRIAGRRARRDSLPSVPGRHLAVRAPTASCCPRSPPLPRASPARPTARSRPTTSA